MSDNEKLAMQSKGYREAVYLATILWEKYYKDDSPDWQPLDSTVGVITQIDNMVSGLTKVKDTRPELIEDIIGALKQLVDLKDYKDRFGKTETYLELQPKAWARARELLKSKL